MSHVPRTSAQARGNGGDYGYELGEYGYKMSTQGTGVTYEDYLNSIVPGTEMPRDMWESLPDPSSVEQHAAKEEAKRMRQVNQYDQKVGGFLPAPYFNSYASKTHQVYADPYIKGGTAPPHYHNPQGKSWSA